MIPRFILVLVFSLMSQSGMEPDPGILVFSRTEGFRHESIEPGIDAIRTLATEHGLTMEATEDPAVFSEDGLSAFRSVVFLNTTLDVLDTDHEKALASFVRSGGGFVGIHSAADTEYDWPWYGQLVGAYFAGHPDDPNVRDGVLHVADSTHEATRGLPEPWMRSDEWYDYRYVNPDVNILLLADEHSYKRPEEEPSSEPHPISWYHEFGGGRVFYTGLGHTSESFVEPLYLRHIWGGIEYTMGNRTTPD